jgi:hypothetical protein
MIDLMKQAVAPKEFNNQFDLLPKGTYNCQITSIGDWKPKTQTSLKVFEFDDSARKVKDEKGNDKFTIEKDITTYSAQVIFEVIDGTYKGVKVYYYLNLHPNQPWAVPSFLNACGITDSVHPREIQELCAGSLVTATIEIETYERTVEDKMTGVASIEERERNVVKRIKPISA